MSFELNSLAFSEETVLHLEHPATGAPLFAKDKKGADDESKPVQIVLKGSASPAYARAVDVMMKQKSKIKNREMTLKEARDQNIEFLTALSVTAHNLTLDGEALDNPEAFRKLYSNSSYDWIKEQVNATLQSAEAFLK